MIANRVTLSQLARGGKAKGSTKGARQAASARHSALVKIVHKRLEYERDMKLWPLRQYAGPPRAGTHPVFWGLVQGASDLVGILAFDDDCDRETSGRDPVGMFVALECKTGKAVQTEEQIEFMKTVRKLGGFYAVVRSVDEALAAIGRARNGETG